MTDAKPFKWQWIDAVARCRNLNGYQIALAMKLGTMATNGQKTATVYAGLEKLSAAFGGRKPTTVSTWRAKLAADGWLRDEGSRRGRAIQYVLAIPECPCRGCRPDASPAGIRGDRDAFGRFRNTRDTVC